MVADPNRIAVFSSENRANLPVYPLDTFVVTDAGAAELNAGHTRLPPEALELLVLMDGKATVGDLEQKMPHIPADALRDLVRALLGSGLVRHPTVEETEGLDFSAFFAATASPDASQGTHESAQREATTGGLTLSRDGYYVSIARQAVKSRTPSAEAPLDVLIIDDDPDVCSLVSLLLEGAGFAVETAMTRDDIIARLRRKPLPDLVLLDVSIPGTNGFDVLANLKRHPVLRAIPVVMLTAEATRESVMRGLVGGADGYMTKPFSKDKLLGGVKAVLGLD